MTAVPAKGGGSPPTENASDFNGHPDFQAKNGPKIQTSRGPIRRYAVYEERNRKMRFLGIAPAPTREEAIATIRRYAMRSDKVRMSARLLKVTKE